jgi:hypothetical protein
MHVLVFFQCSMKTVYILVGMAMLMACGHVDVVSAQSGFHYGQWRRPDDSGPIYMYNMSPWYPRWGDGGRYPTW